jgi:hypothetical protein
MILFAHECLAFLLQRILGTKMKQFYANTLLPIYLVAIIFLAGCASTYNEMEKWVGHKEAEIVSLWGAPSSTLEAEDGVKILTWKKYNFNQNKTCTKSFTIDKNEIITAHSDLDCSLPISFNFGGDQINK